MIHSASSPLADTPEDPKCDRATPAKVWTTELTLCPVPTDPVGQSWPRDTGSVGR